MQHLVTGIQNTRSHGLAGHRAVHQEKDWRGDVSTIPVRVMGLKHSASFGLDIFLQGTAASCLAKDSDPVTQSSQESQ